MKKEKLNVLLVLILVCYWPTVALAGSSMHSSYGDLLKKYVSAGVVDYQGFKNDEHTLDQYLALLNSTNPEKLSQNDGLAYYINTYNAYTVKLILDNFKDGQPVKSIKKIGGFFTKPWSIKFVKAGGKIYSLDNIEHDIIRPIYKDSRVHFAVNCASQSCPPLIAVPYTGETLDQQLDTNTKSFINNKTHNYMKGNTLYISSIFKWFAEDFGDDPISYFKKYAQGELQELLHKADGKIKVKYLDYDWSLNNK